MNAVVALDATPLLGARTGVGHTTAALLDALDAQGGFDLVAFAITWRGRHDLPAYLPARVRAATAPIPARLTRQLWRRVAFPRIELWTGPVDVVHATNFVAPPTKAPIVLTLHDITFLTRPDLCTDDTRGYRALVERALDRGAVLHTFSDTVADAAVRALDVAPARVRRVYPGVGPIGTGDPARGRALVATDRYVLALGTIEPRKNLPVLVRAFAAVAAARPGIRLVVAGPDGWDGSAFATAVSALPDPGVVLRLGYVDDRARADLLAGAAALAYPSLDEGFGHPPLEAMLAGTPVVAAEAGAIPEVVGDAALLVSPTDTEALAEALGRVLDDESLRAELVVRGKERAGRYSWKKAAAELAGWYRELACER